MSYKEKNITVSLISTLLIFGFYWINIYQMYQQESVNPTYVFSLWLTIIVCAIIIVILANILINIVFNIIHYIRTNEDEPFIEDERDELIGLKGARNAYHTISIGVLFATGSIILGMPMLVTFNLIVFFAMTSEIINTLSQLYFYRRGF